jgi:hypothetical protein
MNKSPWERKGRTHQAEEAISVVGEGFILHITW